MNCKSKCQNIVKILFFSRALKYFQACFKIIFQEKGKICVINFLWQIQNLLDVKIKNLLLSMFQDKSKEMFTSFLKQREKVYYITKKKITTLKVEVFFDFFKLLMNKRNIKLKKNSFKIYFFFSILFLIICDAET